MKICVIGLGYIGLPTAAVFAREKYEVLGIDIDEKIIQKINQGQTHIVEPDLNSLVNEVVKTGHLRASLNLEQADVFIICVPTPFKGKNYKADLTYIQNAVKNLARFLKKGDLIILESTSPLGTTQKISLMLSKLRKDLSFAHESKKPDVYIAYCPERVLPGFILKELVSNDRIIGGLTQKCAQKAASLYKSVILGECLITDAKTAEMVKLVENTSRDVQIAFANELSMICDESGVDVNELIALANRHPRVNILKPGCGVGGHCIAVDPYFILSAFPKQSKLIRTARKVNNAKPEFVIQKIIENSVKLKSKKIVCLGLAFKPNTDDLRESPAIRIVEELIKRHYKVYVVEPYIKELPLKLENQCELISLKQALEYENIVILVAHQCFKNKKLFKGKNVLDFCAALYDEKEKQ